MLTLLRMSSSEAEAEVEVEVEVFTLEKALAMGLGGFLEVCEKVAESAAKGERLVVQGVHA